MTAVKWSKWELDHVANTIGVFGIPADADQKQVLAFLIFNADQMHAMRVNDWAPSSRETIARFRSEITNLTSDYSVRTITERIRWHESQLAKTERDARAYARLAAKLREHGLPPNVAVPAPRNAP